MDMETKTKFALSIKEACEVAGIGRTTLYAAIAAGSLPLRKCGRRSLILADDLQAFLLALPQPNIRHDT